MERRYSQPLEVIFRVRSAASRLHPAGCGMQLGVDYAEQFTRLGDRLALEPITEGALRGRALDRLFAVEEGMAERATRNR